MRHTTVAHLAAVEKVEVDEARVAHQRVRADLLLEAAAEVDRRLDRLDLQRERGVVWCGVSRQDRAASPRRRGKNSTPPRIFVTAAGRKEKTPRASTGRFFSHLGGRDRVGERGVGRRAVAQQVGESALAARDELVKPRSGRVGLGDANTESAARHARPHDRLM